MFRRCIAPLLTACLTGGCYGTYQELPADSAPTALAAPAQAAAPPAPAPAPVRSRENYEPLLRNAHAALQRGDYQQALLDYERVLGRADDPRDQIRALISVAKIRLTPSYGVNDAAAAGIVLAELDRRIAKYQLQYEFFGELELLNLVRQRERELREARAAAEKLKRDLAAREELIRQLRAVTVDSN
jgi:hypothetical protein